MKAKPKQTKVHRNFKLDAELDRQLRRQAAADHRTQTAILEMALRAHLLVKAA